MLCIGQNGLGLPNYNASPASLSFGMENVGLRVLDTGVTLLRRSTGHACLNTDLIHLNGNTTQVFSAASLWGCLLSCNAGS